LIYSWERERIFRTCLIETIVVDAHPKLPVGHGDDNRIVQPPQVMDLPYEANVEQLLDFFTNEVLLLHRLLPGLLLNQSDIGVDLQMVPSKHVNICPEEGDEREFLFVAQISHDAGGLGGISAELDGLHRDTLIVQGMHMGC
jgi:hypothetical protein